MKRLLIIAGLSLFIVACRSTSPLANQLSEKKPEDSATRSQRAAALNVQLSAAYLQQGDVNRAKTKILAAMQQAPNWAPALAGMASYLAATGQIKEAESHFKKAIALDGAGPIQNNYGVFLCQRTRYNEAIDHFILATRDPNYIHVADALENAGLCSLSIPNEKQAEHYFQEALIRDPQHLPSLIELADFYTQRSQYEQAHRYLQTYYSLSGPEDERVRLLTEKITKHYHGSDLKVAQQKTLASKSNVNLVSSTN